MVLLLHQARNNVCITSHLAFLGWTGLQLRMVDGRRGSTCPYWARLTERGVGGGPSLKERRDVPDSQMLATPNISFIQETTRGDTNLADVNFSLVALDFPREAVRMDHRHSLLLQCLHESRCTKHRIVQPDKGV